MELYYKIAVSTISTIKKSKNVNNWKISSLFVLSILFTINCLTIWILLIEYIFHDSLDFLSFHFFQSSLFNKLADILFYFFIPIYIIIYLIIFRMKKYETFILKYPEARSRKYFAIYFVSTYSIGLICLFLVVYSSQSK